MVRHPRPTVLISECLRSAPVRWDGTRLEAPFVARLATLTDVVTICPEVALGLGVPRPPIRILASDAGEHLIQPTTGRDLTAEMAAFSAEQLATLAAPDGSPLIDGAVLKSRSPTCGLADAKRYSAPDDDEPVGFGPGLYARALQARWPQLPVEDESRLRQPEPRAHFLTRLFLAADLRNVREDGSHTVLLAFDMAHTLLLMAYSARWEAELQRIAENDERRPIPEVFRRYEAVLWRALAQPATRGADANVLLHAFGQLSPELRAEERAAYVANLQRYRQGALPRTALVRPLLAWAEEQQDAYLLMQSFWAPYPSELDDQEEADDGS